MTGVFSLKKLFCATGILLFFIILGGLILPANRFLTTPIPAKALAAGTTAGNAYPLSLKDVSRASDQLPLENNPSPNRIKDFSNPQMAAGAQHTCVLSEQGGAWCWGGNLFGQLGDGTTATAIEPVAVRGLQSGLKSITAGLVHTCALTSLGGVKCWGRNLFGQLGDGTTIDRDQPVDVIGLSQGVIALSAGADHTCAVKEAGGLVCWGRNFHGQVSGKSGSDVLSPVDLAGLPGRFVSLAAGGSHTCALSSMSEVYCWGGNWTGQLGNGLNTAQSAPVKVTLIVDSGVRQVVAGSSHTCALLLSGTVTCWGDNRYYQAGSTQVSKDYSTQVDSLANVQGLIAKWDRVCALTYSEELWCWGRNQYAELAPNNIAAGWVLPQRVDVVIDSGGLALGLFQTCKLDQLGTYTCWGRDLSAGLNAITLAATGSPAETSHVLPGLVPGSVVPLPTLAGVVSPTQIPANPVTQTGKIAYAAGGEQTAKRSIYIKYLDGQRSDSKITNATDRFGDNYPSFSPDGNTLAFTRCYAQKNDGCDLFIHNLLDNTEKLILKEHKVMRPKWCRSTTSEYADWVVFEDRRRNGNQYQDGDSSLGMANIKTGEFKKLTNSLFDWHPNWSPDCSQIIFTRYDAKDTSSLNAGLMFYDLSTQKDTPLQKSAPFSPPAELSPAWSPDGQWLAYRKCADTNGDGYYNGTQDRCDLWLVSTDGTKSQPVLEASFNIASIAWAADSQSLLFVTVDNNMLVTDLQGNTQDFGGSFLHAAISPDGVFSTRSGGSTGNGKLPAPTPTLEVFPTSQVCSFQAYKTLGLGNNGRVIQSRVDMLTKPEVPNVSDNKVIRTLLLRERIKVKEGPVCTAAGIWWKVISESSDIGWVMEYQVSRGRLITNLGR